MRNIVAENVRQESHTLSVPGESSCSKSVDKPWSGKPRVQATDVSRKGEEKVFEPLDIFAGHSIMDGGDLSGSEMSLDEEFGIQYRDLCIIIMWHIIMHICKGGTGCRAHLL